MPSIALSTPRPLTDKDRAFIDAYLTNGFVASEAAHTAGYNGSKATLSSIGWKTLQEPSVQKELSRRVSENSAKADVKCTEVLQKLEAIASGHMGNVAMWGPDGVTLKDSELLVHDQLMLVKEVSSSPTQFGTKIKIALHDRLKALEILARVYKMIGPDVVQQNNYNLNQFLSNQHGFDPKQERRLGEIVEMPVENLVLPKASRFIMDGE